MSFAWQSLASPLPQIKVHAKALTICDPWVTNLASVFSICPSIRQSSAESCSLLYPLFSCFFSLLSCSAFFFPLFVFYFSFFYFLFCREPATLREAVSVCRMVHSCSMCRSVWKSLILPHFHAFLFFPCPCPAISRVTDLASSFFGCGQVTLHYVCQGA